MNCAATKLKKYTWDDYRTWPDEERWEVIDGNAYAMSPSPGVRHQMVQVRLASELDRALRGSSCRALVAPMDVKFTETDIVQPDVMVVCRAEQNKGTHIEGAPALVAEILSDSSERHDRGIKMRLYAEHGVPEVWLVRPYPSLIEVFRLDGEGYRVAGTYSPPGRFRSPGFPKLRLRLDDIFDFPLSEEEKTATAVRESPSPEYKLKRKAALRSMGVREKGSGKEV